VNPRRNIIKKYSTILSINIKNIIICVVNIIIFLILESIHIKKIIICVLNIIIFLIIESIHIKKYYYLCSKYYYFSYNSNYSYQNIIICILNIIIFLIIQYIHIKDINICIIILIFL
jgi:hypothetical protein